MKSYIYVGVMTAVIASSLFVYKSCDVDVPNIGTPVSVIGNIVKPKPKKPKPSTPGSTTTVVTKPDGTTTTVVEVKPVQIRKNKAGVGVSTDIGLKDRVYHFTLERRVFDNVWVGTTVDSTQRIGTIISVEF